jgi:hypothetical protein
MATSTLGSGTLVLAGTTSGTTTVTATAVAGTTTLTLPAATDTLVGKATTDTLTNKTLTGAVMNGTLGATTPSTVAATTISASSTATFAAGAAGTPSITTTGDTNTGIFFPAADTIAFAEGGVEVARFDSAGNFGLGVTPSAWDSTYKAIQVGARSMFFGIGSEANMANNAYYNSGYKYVATSAAGLYTIDANVHKWYNAASGTAGNAISFTQAMTLDASGNLLVGGTSQSGTANRTAVFSANKFGLSVIDTTAQAAGVGGALNLGGNYRSAGDAQAFARVSAVKQNSTDADFGYGMAFSVTPNGGTFTEAGRFDSSGNLLVGTTSGSYHKLVKNAPGNYATEVSNTSTTPYGLYISYSAAAPNSSIAEFLYCSDTAGQKMAVRSNGGIANYSASNVNLSDRREKTNFAPAGDYLSKICAIPVQTFNYIDQNMEDDGGLTLGVVAQDVQAVAPELVMESNWAGKDEEPKMRLGIYQTDLQYALMKCIQEQQALITQLTARITALESA